jgi:hypothetical protein
MRDLITFDDHQRRAPFELRIANGAERDWCRRLSSRATVEVMKVEVLYFDGCPSHEALMPRLRELMVATGVDAPVELKRVESVEAAERERFLGSPTLRVNGQDVDPTAGERTDFGLKCRLYPSAAGLRGTVPDEFVLEALTRIRRRCRGAHVASHAR